MINYRIKNWEKLTFPQIEAFCEKYIRCTLRGLSDKQVKAIGYRCQTVDFKQTEDKIDLVMRDEEGTTYRFHGKRRAE